MKSTVHNSSSSFSFSFWFSNIFVSWLLLSHRVVDAFDLNYEGEALRSLMKRFIHVGAYRWQTDKSDYLRLSWNNLSSSNTPCNWMGVGCNTVNTHIVTLDLYGFGLYGQLGPEIGQLRYLTSVYLTFNNFNGSIPKELWNCSHLQHLDLTGNNFIGELPEAMANLHQLKTFSAHGNHLSGRIPKSLFQISTLEFISLNLNNLTGSIPFIIGNATNIKELWLEKNSLDGNIPTSIANCTKLRSLGLSYNGLSGEIPLGVWRIPTLEIINVGNNNISGELPVEVTKLHHLESIHLNNNQFSGLVPDALGINSTSLGSVDFSNNAFSGKIPPNLCSGKLLATLVLSNNQMNGTLPHCLGDSNGLQTLILRNNYFSGTLPSNFTSDQLDSIDLNGNHFEGKIPRINSPYLSFLDLGNNQLEDTFPFFLEILSELEILVLRSNKFYGPLKCPHTCFTFNKLKVLDISSNYFTGDLPLEFCLGLEAMKHMDLFDRTALIYYYPISTVVIHKGIELTLNRTLLTTFRAIDFSNNRFQGTIPELIGELLWLKSINLSNNNLHGRIPSLLGNLTELESLDLSHNKLSGEIPWQLTNIHFLAILNLSHNNLIGRIPNVGQFQTFPNDSFKGNPGLCGYQSSSRCGDDANKESHQNPIKEDENSKFWNFGWEPVVIGYGCGIIISLFIQYFLYIHKGFAIRWFG